jgi:hypothetical protein
VVVEAMSDEPGVRTVDLRLRKGETVPTPFQPDQVVAAKVLESSPGEALIRFTVVEEQQR